MIGFGWFKGGAEDEPVGCDRSREGFRGVINRSRSDSSLLTLPCFPRVGQRRREQGPNRVVRSGGVIETADQMDGYVESTDRVADR